MLPCSLLASNNLYLRGLLQRQPPRAVLQSIKHDFTSLLFLLCLRCWGSWGVPHLQSTKQISCGHFNSPCHFAVFQFLSVSRGLPCWLVCRYRCLTLQILFIPSPFWQMLHMLCCTSLVVPHEKRRPVLLAVPGAAAIPGGYTMMSTESRHVSDPEFHFVFGLCWARTRQLWSCQGATSLHLKPATIFSFCLQEEFFSCGSSLLDFFTTLVLHTPRALIRASSLPSGAWSWGTPVALCGTMISLTHLTESLSFCVN